MILTRSGSFGARLFVSPESSTTLYSSHHDRREGGPVSTVHCESPDLGCISTPGLRGRHVPDPSKIASQRPAFHCRIGLTPLKCRWIFDACHIQACRHDVDHVSGLTCQVTTFLNDRRPASDQRSSDALLRKLTAWCRAAACCWLSPMQGRRRQTYRAGRAADRGRCPV